MILISAILLLPEHLGLNRETTVSACFGVNSNSASYPDGFTLPGLLHEYNNARLIWRTIILNQMEEQLPATFSATQNWSEKIKWVSQNSEIVAKIFEKADQQLEKEQKYHLLLFDALDRCADDWKIINQLVQGLMQNLLDFRSYRRIRPKVFIRPDQIENSEVFSFPDASKISTRKIELYWQRTDLYGLFWQYLANHSELFRTKCLNIDKDIKWEQKVGVWVVPAPGWAKTSITRLSDKRINIPDVYRVGYNIGRRGGIKPAAGNSRR